MTAEALQGMKKSTKDFLEMVIDYVDRHSVFEGNDLDKFREAMRAPIELLSSDKGKPDENPVVTATIAAKPAVAPPRPVPRPPVPFKRPDFSNGKPSYQGNPHLRK